MPGYGIADANEGKGLLAWSWAVKRLTKSHNYFVSTVRPDGRAHTMPVWGVWVNDTFYFSTGRTSRKARNLRENPNCVVCPENASEAVVVEGIAKKLTAASVPAGVKRAYKAKYDWALDPALGPIFAVRPRIAFGFIEANDEFTATATRWVF
jgi:nitroimidazol reductase NimA-like FMN-containing flavoprotein (pyridoxamine 5'-phosphate oxidase superfamily)